MPKMIFRGAFLRHCVTQDDESGVFVRAHVTSSFSKPVCEAMGWEDVPDSVKSAKLDGALNATVRATGVQQRMGWTNEPDGGGLFESAKIWPMMRDPFVVDWQTGEMVREVENA